MRPNMLRRIILKPQGHANFVIILKTSPFKREPDLLRRYTGLGYGMYGPGFESQHEWEIFLFFKIPTQTMEATKPFTKRAPGLFAGGKTAWTLG